jgi:hypothetical protein
MSHMTKVSGYVKRSMPRNYKNTGSKAMGVQIQQPRAGEAESSKRSKVLHNPVKNVGRGTFDGYRHTPSLAGVKSEERAEDMGKC